MKTHFKELTKEELVFAIIKKDGGISKMKVNNQVASNPIGFYESGKNFATLPCRLTHFTRTNYEKYNKEFSSRNICYFLCSSICAEYTAFHDGATIYKKWGISIRTI